MTYSNYQLRTQQIYGLGWVLIGDSAGFVDPVFSTGLFLALDGAAKFVSAFQSSAEYEYVAYQQNWSNEIIAWQSVIEHWYNGRLLTLFQLGQKKRNTVICRLLNQHITKHITRIFTGEIPHGSYSHKLMQFLSKRTIIARDAEINKII